MSPTGTSTVHGREHVSLAALHHEVRYLISDVMGTNRQAEGPAHMKDEQGAFA